MADEEKKDYTESKNNFLDILARGGEGMIDGLAKSYPMVGGALQAMVGTQDYQDRVDARNYEREQREHGRQVMAEWNQNKATRDAVSQATLKSAQADAMRADEYMSPEAQAARMSGYKSDTEAHKLKEAQARYGQSMVWAQRQNDYAKNVTQDYINYFGNDPNCTMSTPEITSMANSPAVQTAIKAQYWLGKMLGIADGDKDSFDEIDNELNQMGWDAYFDQGVMYLKMGNENPFPVTKESLNMVGNIIEKNMMDEQAARDAVSLNNSIGSPDRMWNRKMTEAASKFTGGNYAEAKKFVEGYTKNLTPEQGAWMRLRQAYEDFGDSSLPMSARMDELAACMQSLDSLDYWVDGFDPSNPATIMMAQIKEKGKGPNAKTYTLPEFSELCKQKDTVTPDITARINENMMRYAQDTIQKSVQNVKDTAKAAKGQEEQTPEEAKAKAVDEYRSEIKTMLEDEHEDFWGLDDDAQDKVVTVYEDYERHKKSALKKSKAKDVYGLPEDTVRNLDANWKNGTKGLVDESSTLSRSPVADVLDELEAARKQYNNAKEEYEKPPQRTDLIRPSYAYMTPEPKPKGKKIPADLMLKKSYSSIEEELKDLNEKSAKLYPKLYPSMTSELTSLKR